jgi:hypothetical protein
MTLGDVDAWAEVFPEDLVPSILDLVWTTWQSFPKPAAKEHEVPITRRFRCALKQAKDYIRLPVRIDREPAEDDPATAQELGRIDLRFSPAGSALEEVYFAFECKRLNATENGTRRPRASEYVTEGMIRFVIGQYATAMRHGGMIGYVLGGNCDHAIGLVAQNIGAKKVALRMRDSGLAASSLRQDNAMIRETMHDLGRAEIFRLHHLFLSAVVNKGPQAQATSGQTGQDEAGNSSTDTRP